MLARHFGYGTLISAVVLLANVGCSEIVSQQPKSKDAKPTEQKGAVPVEKITKTDEEWKQQLTGEQYYVTRQKGTERPFTGKYWNHHEAGVYKCVCCGAVLFDSTTKFDSGCGWPSFYAPTTNAQITSTRDLSHGMDRIEVTCTKCGAHLGHIFDDGPKPTGKRFCINSASLDFEKKK